VDLPGFVFKALERGPLEETSKSRRRGLVDITMTSRGGPVGTPRRSNESVCDVGSIAPVSRVLLSSRRTL